MKQFTISGMVFAASVSALATTATAEGEVNLYSSRHYDTDERLYSDFTDLTGITINRIEGKADELIARMQAEGANSPADVLLTVDTSRLERAKNAGVLQAIDSDVLEGAIPAALQDSDNQWFGFSQRARIIFYDKTDVTNPPMTYVDLADPAYAGNTDQLRGLVSGECDISISNTYYFSRALRRDVDGLSAEAMDNIGWVFPAQNAEGAHMNLSGGGVAANAPNKENAVKFLEYLASEQAQEYFSAGNDEYPAVPGVGLSDSVAKLGLFRPDAVNLSAVAKNVPTAQTIFNEVGWE